MSMKLLLRLLLTGLTLMTLIMAGCAGDDGSVGATGANGTDAPVAPLVPTFSVKDTAGLAVEGATVYAIPAAAVAEISAVEIIQDAAGNYDADVLAADEPLEDLINGNFGDVTTFIKGTTDANGEAVLTALPVGATDMYFIYVAPAATDAGHLPGGSMTRDAVSGASLDMTLTAVEISTTQSVRATYVGSSACLACHTAKETQTQTAHRHGMMAIGSPSALQDLAKFDDDDAEYEYMKGVDNFTAGDATTGGTTVWFYNYDSTRGFDKFQTSLTDPSGEGVTVYATVRAYLEGDVYKMQFNNVINPGSTNDGMIREAMMTYGGGVYKQRYMTSFGDSESLYILPLQYQATGDDANADRTRKQYRDYHLDFWMTGLDTETPTFKSLPAAKRNFDINCASCHFTGFSVVKNDVTGEHIASGIADDNGIIHPLQVARGPQELNVGCETCHGPGSEHISADGNGAAIVTPQNLTSSRETVICGQCHSRAQGNDTLTSGHNDSTLDTNNQMMKPGTSRADYLANNTSQHDAKGSKMWADGIHSKAHHQQYTDFIKSSKYRNDSMLLTCTSCHDVHAPGTDRHQLSGSTSDNSLCLSCHATKTDVSAHMVDKIGPLASSMGAIKCIECHNVKTAKSGAGAADALDGGDITSHVFDVPLSATDAMPIPFNNSCGGCH